MKEEAGCYKCKPKDITISQIELYSKEEFDEIMPMLDRYSMTPQEIQYIYDFYKVKNLQVTCFLIILFRHGDMTVIIR